MYNIELSSVMNPISIKKYFTIEVGVSRVRNRNRKLLAIDKVVAHPSYHPETMDYDVAIVFLAKNLTFGQTVDSIDLPPMGFKLPIGEKATVSGWGKIKVFFYTS